LFNVLLWWVLPGKPLIDKGVSISVATVSAYVMNRNLTWADRARTGLRRELPLFALLSLIGLGISEVTLATSHYGLGYTWGLADRGAPLLGIAGAYGVALAAARGDDVDAAAVALAGARPTAVNLAWAVDKALAAYRSGGAAAALETAREIERADAAAADAIA